MTTHPEEKIAFAYINTLTGAARDKWPKDGQAFFDKEGTWAPRTIISNVMRAQPQISKEQYEKNAVEFFWARFQWTATRTKELIKSKGLRAACEPTHKTIKDNAVAQTALIQVWEELENPEWRDLFPVVNLTLDEAKVLERKFKKENFWNQEFAEEDYNSVEYAAIAKNIVKRVAISSKVRGYNEQFKEYLYVTFQKKMAARSNDTDQKKFEASFTPANATERDQFLTLMGASGTEEANQTIRGAEGSFTNRMFGWLSKEALQAAAGSKTQAEFEAAIVKHHGMQDIVAAYARSGLEFDYARNPDSARSLMTNALKSRTESNIMKFASSNFMIKVFLKEHLDKLGTDGDLAVIDRLRNEGKFEEAVGLFTLWVQQNQTANYNSKAYLTATQWGPTTVVVPSLRDGALSHPGVTNEHKELLKGVFGNAWNDETKLTVLKAVLSDADQSFRDWYVQAAAAATKTKTPVDKAYETFMDGVAPGGNLAEQLLYRFHRFQQLQDIPSDVKEQVFERVYNENRGSLGHVSHNVVVDAGQRDKYIKGTAGVVQAILQHAPVDSRHGLENAIRGISAYGSETYEATKPWTWLLFRTLLDGAKTWDISTLAHAIAQAAQTLKADTMANALADTLGYCPLNVLTPQIAGVLKTDWLETFVEADSDDDEKPVYGIVATFLDGLVRSPAETSKFFGQFMSNFTDEKAHFQLAGKWTFSNIKEFHEFLNSRYSEDVDAASAALAQWLQFQDGLNKKVNTRMSENNVLGGIGMGIGDMAAKVSGEKSFMATRGDRALEGAKQAGTNQFLKLTTAGLAGIMARQAGDESAPMIAMFTAFLESDLGRAFQAIVMAVPMSMINHPVAQDIHARLETKGYELAADTLMEVAMGPIRDIVKNFAATVGKDEKKRVSIEDIESVLAERAVAAATGAPKLEVVTDDLAAQKVELKAGSK